MPLDLGRVTHLIDQMHRSEDDAGDPIAAGMLLAADGARGQEWVDPSSFTGDFVTKIEGGQDTIKVHGSMGSTETIDPTDGNVHTGMLNAACTITLNNPVGSGAATLEIYFTQDGTGGWAVTWPGSVTFPAGTTITTTAGTLTRYVLETLDGGSSWLGNVVGAGGSALTIKDEGTPLATAATSLDSVGAGVTASGATAAKTITIPGGATSSDTSMWRPLMDGAGNVVTDGTGQAVMAFS